ncbi:MAG TPA: hypothetical protein VK177_10065 [Flavobacteriales bacterium]|nr:hypothetical protein [Flavobacteriales bacterium]
MLKSFVKDGKVYLRWAPSTVQLFELGLKNGYTLEKYTGGSQVVKTGEIIFKPVYEKLDSIKVAGTNVPPELVIAAVFKGGKMKDNEKTQLFAYRMLDAGHNLKSAKTHGLYYAEAAENNTYRVCITGTNSTSNLMETSAQNSTVKPIVLDAVKLDKKRPVLNWEAASGIGDYSAYWVERSTDGNAFEKISKAPFFFLKSQFEKTKTHCTVLDTNAARGQTYSYRVVGINHFAMEMPPSNSQKIYIPNAFNPLVKIDTVLTAKNMKTIRASLVFDKQEEAKYAKSLVLQVSNDEKNFTTVSNLSCDNKLSFIFTDEVERNRVNYRIGAISTDDDTVFSYAHYYFIPDADPPASPLNVSGTIDKNGIVQLTWKVNTENDIKGYKIYRANNLKEEFVERTQNFCVTTVFTDTVNLNNLDSLIYYKVIAVDLNYNHSTPSQPLKLTKPDKIAPVAVVIKTVEGKQNGLLVKWNRSSSADVKLTKLWRIKNGSPKLFLLMHVGDTTTQVIDTGVVAGNFYVYKFEVIDHSGNVSESKSGQHKFEPGFRNALSGFTAVANIEKHQIELSWNRPEERVHSYQVYRLKNKGRITLLKTIEPGNTRYIDTELNINNTYTYAIKAVFLNGVHSKMTELVEVNY